MTIHVRAIRAGDWQIARDLRLASLADSPDAFASTLELEQSLPESAWKARVTSNAAQLDTAGFFAVHDNVECGTAVGIWRGGEPAEVELAAMWVAPYARRQGAARLLVEQVCDWARTRGAGRVSLEVTTTSVAAITLYSSLGFQRVSEVKPSCGERRAPAFRMQREPP